MKRRERRMRRGVLLLAVVITSVYAQVQQLTTDHTGSVLYFASTLNQAGAESEPHSKIFRWDAKNGIQTFLVRAKVWGPPGLRGAQLTNYYDLQSPSVSGDGSRLLYVGHQQCQG